MASKATDALIRLCDIGMAINIPVAGNPYPDNLRPTILRGDPFQPDDVASASCPFWLFELPLNQATSDLPIASGQQYISTNIDAILCVARRESNTDLKYSVYEALSWRDAVYAQYAKHLRLSDPSRIVTNATNASPIQVQTYVPHRYTGGEQVTVSGVLGNTAANGPWNITVTGFDTFTLNGSTGNGTFIYDNGGVVRKTQPSDMGNVVSNVIKGWSLQDHQYGASAFLALMFRMTLTEYFVTTISE